MTHEEAFLADIIEHPEDDAPRLIFADWLEENGQPERAELIRVQCELEKMDLTGLGFWSGQFGVVPGWVGRANALRRRERELLDAHSFSWLCRPLMDLESEAAGRAWFCRRGFIAQVTLPCADWLEHGPAIVQAAPIERVVPSDKKPWKAADAIWSWFREGPDRPAFAAPSERIPAPIFDSLRQDRYYRVDYDSRIAAMTALSAACISYARNRVEAQKLANEVKAVFFG